MVGMGKTTGRQSPSRRLDLGEESKEAKVEEIKKEVVEDGNGLSLECNEKIGDSPSPGKKQEGRVKQKKLDQGGPVKQELKQEQENTPSLLKPLAPEPGETSAPTCLQTTTGEFGLVQLGKREVAAPTVTSPPPPPPTSAFAPPPPPPPGSCIPQERPGNSQDSG